MGFGFLFLSTGFLLSIQEFVPPIFLYYYRSNYSIASKRTLKIIYSRSQSSSRIIKSYFLSIG
jgi:hypothetical protein